MISAILTLALAGLPVYVSAGTFVTATTGTCTPGLPAGYFPNDILLLVVESENDTNALTTANGFVEVTNSPQGAGTLNTNPANNISVYWKRAVGGDSAPIVTAHTDHTTCRLYAFTGVRLTGNPWNITAGGNDSAANDTSANIPGATTTVNDALVVLIQGTSNNATATTNCGAVTNANLANITERTDNSNTVGLGGGHCLITGELATAGTYATSTLTMGATTFKGAMSIALEGATYTVGALRFHDTDGVQDLVAPIPGNASYTIAFWVRIQAHAGFTKLVQLANVGATVELQWQFDNGANKGFWGDTGAGLVDHPSAYSHDVWYFVALSHNGSADFLYTNTEAGTGVKTAATTMTSLVSTAFTMSTTNGGTVQDYALVRIWSAALTQSELDSESASATTVRTSNLWASYAFATVAGALTDGSGNGRSLTSTGSPVRTPTNGPTFAAASGTFSSPSMGFW